MAQGRSIRFFRFLTNKTKVQQRVKEAVQRTKLSELNITTKLSLRPYTESERFSIFASFLRSYSYLKINDKAGSRNILYRLLQGVRTPCIVDSGICQCLDLTVTPIENSLYFLEQGVGNILIINFLKFDQITEL